MAIASRRLIDVIAEERGFAAGQEFLDLVEEQTGESKLVLYPDILRLIEAWEKVPYQIQGFVKTALGAKSDVIPF